MLGRVIASVAGIALLLTACGGDDAEPSTDLGSDDSTSTTQDPEAAVLEAYEAGWQAFNEASRQPVDPALPALEETMTGEALESARQSLNEWAEAGEYIDGPPVDTAPQVTDLGESEATLEDCVIEESVLRAADGSEVESADTEPTAFRATMVKEGDTWKNDTIEALDPCTR